MENIKVRDAQLGDLIELRKFEQELIKAERPFDITIAPNPVTYYDLESFLSSDDVKIVVVESGVQLIGCGYARIKDARPYLDHEQFAYFGFMYTKPEFRGYGVNKLVMQTLTDWTRQQGLNEIRLTVYPENFSAVKAYEKVGFSRHITEMRMRINNEGNGV